jgi:hypothetical protein
VLRGHDVQRQAAVSVPGDGEGIQGRGDGVQPESVLVLQRQWNAKKWKRLPAVLVLLRRRCCRVPTLYQRIVGRHLQDASTNIYTSAGRGYGNWKGI